jgi:MoaA/NifB/PqqE/SkfB family radical SAM enzyme
MLDLLRGFHIEPTNICTLKCPGCPRTQFINSFPRQWKNKQLNLADLQKFIDIDINKKIFNVCGNYGDPIYYDNLLNLVKWIKQNGGIVNITTNGSYKTKEWWIELCSLLSFDDYILFSIDGLPGSFKQYRINADWNSIEIGINTSVKFTNVVWKFIPFAFNEEEISQAEEMSKNLGMHAFLIDPSDRWNENVNYLKPNNKNLFGDRTEHIVNWVSSKKTTISPRCKTTHYEHNISADGYYTPCCGASDHRFYFSSEFYKNKKMYDISNTTLTEVLKNLTSFYDNIEENQLKYCTFNCPAI